MPFEYFKYLLTEIPTYTDKQNTDFLAELWSKTLLEYIRKTK